MSVLKSELKMLLTTEIGVRVEDSLEAAKRDLSVLEGRQVAFADGAKAVEALLALVDKDVTDEVYDLPTATIVKRFLGRAATALQNLSSQAGNLRMVQTGRIQGLDHTVALLKNMVDAEKARVASLTSAESTVPPENPRDRETGVRPAATLKERRLSEEKEQEKELIGSEAEVKEGELPVEVGSSEAPPETLSSADSPEPETGPREVDSPEASDTPEVPLTVQEPPKRQGKRRASNA